MAPSDARPRERGSRLAPSPARQGRLFWRPPLRQGPERLGSLIYVGRGLFSVRSNDPEPALIDLSLPAAGATECGQRLVEDSPSFSTSSPEARGSYLLWLRTGRSDPRADIGYVWLYFYGLERRLLHDSLTDPAARTERPRLVAELGRLLETYGRHAAFKRQALQLLDFLFAQDPPPRTYREAPPHMSGALMTLQERVALGQCAQDGAALPAAWALRWVSYAPEYLRSGTASHDPERFAALFTGAYRARHGAGFLLPSAGRFPRLEGRYCPASPSFQGHEEGVRFSSGLPDVWPYPLLPPELASLALEVDELARRGGGVELLPGIDTVAGLAAHPVDMWPPRRRLQVMELAEQVERSGGITDVGFATVLARVPDLQMQRRREEHVALCGLLARVGLGMEPDPRFGGTLPASARRVVLFADEPATVPEEVSAVYIRTALEVQLAAELVWADDSRREFKHALIDARIQAASPATAAERRHLRGLLRLSLTLRGRSRLILGGKVRLLDTGIRAGILDFLVDVACADGCISLAEMRCLDRSVGELELGWRDAVRRVEAAVHSGRAMVDEEGRQHLLELQAVARAFPDPDEDDVDDEEEASAVQVTLDPDRVAALQQESLQLRQILDPVFAPEEEGEPACATPADGPGVGGEALLGLDAGASGFLRALLARREWCRAELTALARGRGLPLDGVLERINEACYEQLDMPLFEDGDPLVLRPEAVAAVGAERGS